MYQDVTQGKQMEIWKCWEERHIGMIKKNTIESI